MWEGDSTSKIYQQKLALLGCGAISAKYLENAEKFDALEVFYETANYIRDIWDQV